MKKRRVLVIDDEKSIRETLSQILADEGYAVTAIESGEEGLRRLREENFDLAFLDVWLRDRDGLSVLEAADGRLSEIPVVMISGHANVETAVRAVRLGAYDFLEKPLSLQRVILTAQKAIERRDLLAQVASFRGRSDTEATLLGEAPAMEQLRREIARVASTDARVLITGENGTGKELVARSIHRQSERADSPLVEVNCAAIPEELIESELFGHLRGSFTGASEDRRGKFEEADGGTLFLDEVGDMSARTQSKVLRALQEGRFTRVGGSKPISSDARVLSATNKNLSEEIRRGTFREDLFFRLAVIPITVPPLRERREDIPLLARHFLHHASLRFGRRPKELSAGALDAFAGYRWPGNVRELKNLVERLMILCSADEIRREDLPSEILDGEPEVEALPAGAPLKNAREDFERRYILAALRRHRGNITRAAEELQVERSNLYRKLKSYGIEVERE
ncbi:MAG TPA: sigma-54 dependent transcriptional regulator [Thermoanaerobaculia bacterium]|jgi:two-component system nitrogen regulation response regulator NtrX|nr:sigma-54 dependent transcriptional regulator [Thermoanaerobaculia bacterium]